MTELYDRKWELAVTTFNGTQISVSNSNTDNALRTTFDINKNIQRSYQFAEFAVYNLDPDTETNILENGYQLTFSAGYKSGLYGSRFQGFIRQPIRGKEKDGVTYFLKLLCIDSNDALELGLCNFVMSNGQTAQQIAAQVARNTKPIPFQLQIDPNFTAQATQQSPRGKTVFGKPANTLRSLAIDNNAFFYTNNGVPTISSMFKPPPAEVPKLNAQTGMIGIPTQVDYGVQVQTLIRPDIDIDTFVLLNNKDVIVADLDFGVPQVALDRDGLYRVVGIHEFGDTRGNDWYSQLETVAWGGGQGGALPTMASDASLNVQ